jgi:hypothetical protein
MVKRIRKIRSFGYKLNNPRVFRIHNFSTQVKDSYAERLIIAERKADKEKDKKRFQKLSAKMRHQRANYLKKFSASDGEEFVGLKRFILPEIDRPFVQRLSAAAGRIAVKDLKKML